jgi:hypothetical protein
MAVLRQLDLDRAPVVRVREPPHEPGLSRRSRRFVIAPLERPACSASWRGERRWGGPIRRRCASTLHSPKLRLNSASVFFHLLVHRERVETLRRAFDDGADSTRPHRRLARRLLGAPAAIPIEGRASPDRGIPLPVSEDGAFT